MKKILLLIFLNSILFSEQISIGQARIVAENFMSANKNDVLNINSINTYEKNGTIIFYYVNFNPSGFVIIGADNRIKPILGYSFKNNFSVNNTSSNLQWLFRKFHKEFEISVEALDSPSTQILEQWDYYSNSYINNRDRDMVQPLISAQFDQGPPWWESIDILNWVDYDWNAMCPEDSSGPGGHALVGCVAVAMAQVMHYWQHPSYGYGENSYLSNYGVLEADFGNTFYDFENMSATESDAENQLLLYHAGVSVNMIYGPQGSGAFTTLYLPDAMTDNFLYDDGLTYITDDNENYESLLKIELDNERPIVYRACSDDDSWSYDGCHAWNVDGYDSDNFNSTYFHCNWGWGGNDDGYFSLSCLCPDSIDLHWWEFDIGNFNDDQGAFIGIQPKIEGCMDFEAVNYDENAEISCENCCDYCEDGTILDIVIVPDNNPDETEWMLCQNLYGTGLIGADCWFAYGVDEEGSVGDDICLREPASYGFAIYDTGFDGICCEDGNGYYQLILNDELIVEGGDFGEEEWTWFNYVGIDTDNDGISDEEDNCIDDSNSNQENYDGDEQGDACDWDDDNDGVLDTYDPHDNNELICGDQDEDGCDDCSSGSNDTSNDGFDLDGDGQCDVGDIDDDNDGWIDIIDNCPNEFNEYQSNYDGDEQGDACDWDDDNDGVIDTYDPQDNNELICGDQDEDGCDDCSSGSYDISNDGADLDGDGQCDVGDVDDDNDGWIDIVDNCPEDSNESQSNYDGDEQGDACDLDDDNDGYLDIEDCNPFDYEASNFDCCGVCGGDNSSCSCLGDVNDDGEINVVDVVAVVDIIMNFYEYDSIADLNQDGIINVSDIVQLIGIILNGRYFIY